MALNVDKLTNALNKRNIPFSVEQTSQEYVLTFPSDKSEHKVAIVALSKDNGNVRYTDFNTEKTAPHHKYYWALAFIYGLYYETVSADDYDWVCRCKEKERERIL